jgi:hypothetical protein
MLPEDVSQPEVAPPLERESMVARALACLAGASEGRVISASASLVRTSSPGKGVRHCGQTSPASFGTTTAAQLGQERMLDTRLGAII